MESMFRKKIREAFQDFSGLKIPLLREKLEKEFVPTLEEKTQYAEVTTPYVLMEEMLDSIPSSFWECPDKKVFEPCCGKGGFVLSLFERFFKGLQDIMEDEVARSTHILNNILYFADISLSNIIITREMLKAYASFRCQGSVDADAGADFSKVLCCGFCGNSLGYRDGIWSGLFDAVVGNPPFNAGPEHKIILWPEFVYRALEVWIKGGGYLLFLHPPGWRKPFTRRRKNYTHIFDLMTQDNQMLKLSINGKKEGWAKFNCGTRFDHYLISTFPKGGAKSSHSQSLTLAPPFPKVEVEINDEDGIISHIDLTQWKWLPSKNYGLISSILAKEGEERCPIMYSRSSYGTDKSWMCCLKNEEVGFVYPCVHSTLKGGIVRYYYSKFNNKGFFGDPKVIFGESGIFEPILDLDGTYAMTHCAMAISISGEEEGTKIVQALKSDKFDKLIQSCCFSSFRIDWRMFIDFKRDFYLEFI
jgi:hypothetical protein